MPEDKKDDEPKKGKKDKEGDGDDGAPAVVPVDARVQWFEERVCSSLKIKNDKWKKLISVGENVEIIYQFLDKDFTTILFYLTQKEELLPAVNFPSQLKRKAIYFTKKRPGAQITEKLDQELILGDLSANPLEFLSTVLEEVYLPLLTNPKNLESWPEVVASDVLRHFHQLNGAVYVISGKSKGKTMLPLPHGARVLTESDKSILHTLESAVIDWTHQIKEVIKSSSSAPLDEGLNPGPIVEIDFWAAKAANLKSIHQQLTDEKIQKIAKVLQASKSTYYPAFQLIFDEVVFALEEASDINTYLKALRPQVERLAGASELAELSQIFPGLMHTLLMIWKSSKHYNTPNRLTVVIQEICNDIIDQARTFIQPAEIFAAEPEEAAERLRLVLRICDSFKTTYFEYKTSTAESSRPWNFDSRMIFGRLDKFLVRVQQILELFEIIIEFNRLEKIEIGGTKGKILSSQVAQIFTEFVAALSVFGKLKYDVLDIALPDFNVDRGKFHEKITDLDRRIGTILCQAFDDCSGLYSCFRLLESFSGLLNRSNIQKDFEQKYFELLSMYSQDLDDVSVIFLRYKDAPPIHYNMAPVTGAVAWIHELKDRITKAMEKLKTLNHSVMNTDEASTVKNKYNELLAALDAYEQGIFNKWKDNIIDESEANLNKPVLIREANLLKVNFDPKVVALLREVKYFGALSVQPPPAAVDIYAKAETFRKYIFSLENIANMYNGIRTGVLDVERPLIEDKIQQIDAQIEQGVTSLNWKSESIDTYIAEISGTVGNLSSVLQIMKNNLNQITKILKQWSANPLIERKDGKKLLNLEEKEAKLNTANEVIRKDGQTILNLVEQTRQLVEAAPETEQWSRYRKHVDMIVQKGFWTTVKSSMEYILQNMESDRAAEIGPLLEAKLELENEMLVFTPSMDEDSPEGLMSIIESLIEDIYDVSSLMPRVAPVEKPPTPAAPAKVEGDAAATTAAGEESGELLEGASESGKALGLLSTENDTYLGEMRQDETLDNMRVSIIEHVRNIIESCAQYKEGYDQYTYLWTENRQEYMKQFLQPAETTDAEGDAAAQAEEEQPIQLEKFETEIRKFEGIHKTVMALDPEVIFEGWFRIDARPLKQSLNVVVKKWSYTLTKHLSDDTVNMLNELNRFVKLNKKGLQGKIEEGDYDGLVAAMGLLHAIKHRTASIDKMFEPLRKTVNLLRQFGVELPEEIHKLLNDLPEEWSEVKKLSVSIKDHVAPLQAKEVDVLQQKCNRFEMKNHNFREEFRKKAPFKFEIGPNRAYELIDAAHFDVLAMETEATSLKKSCELFELNVPTYRQLADCRRDIGMLKSIWDLVSLVTYMFGQWRTTLWTEIDTDSMENRCRDLSKELRRMDKEIKGWDAYAGLDQMVKDMITSLRAVGELRSNAIRDRHWKQLMKTTGVTFVLTKDMKFQDLLSLQLHKYEDDVKVIVDRATKELAMEKVLNDLDKTWSAMEFTYEIHESTKTPLLRSSEELIETLEDNQVMLQNMMTSKYVAHFEEQITKWQIALSTVDTVITLWLEVQQTWSHLENIFLGSEDIRAQLPEDSRRFDGIDASYKALMNEAQNTPNCVKACTKEGLFEKLEHLEGQLALCEKSLAEYLETKRLAFPRFYFVSASDLLDILAKGNMPDAVAIHLPKLFDSISRLEFQKSPSGELTKTAIGMYSREDEYVPFVEKCQCTGPVETWLNRLVDSMCSTLRHLLGEAVASYEEKPREQWIFDHPAQITLAGTQIWWTTEVNVAFSRLEEGYENSLKDYYKKQVNQLTALIGLIQGELTRGHRQMIMTVCTLDVHARDIVAKLIAEKAENAQCFSWQSQLRLRWDDVDQNDCFVNICDAGFRYNYEYLGNTPRLVITALTDRCYITLTQALHLIMGGAPAGPAGTGKCWGRGTQLVMLDGTAKAVEEICEGDVLMGPDSQPRAVRPGSITRGTEAMYRVTATDDARISWTCNGPHILVLQLNAKPTVVAAGGRYFVKTWTTRPGTSAVSQIPCADLVGGAFSTRNDAEAFIDELVRTEWQPLVFECTVVDYLAIKDESLRQSMAMFQPPLIEWPSPAVSLAARISEMRGPEASFAMVAQIAWAIGAWLALSTGSGRVEICEQVHSEFERIAAMLGEGVPGKCGSAFSALIGSYWLAQATHIPHELMTECPTVRRALLAGLVDRSGSIGEDGGCTITSASAGILTDAASLARGLGLVVGKSHEHASIAVRGAGLTAVAEHIVADDKRRAVAELASSARGADSCFGFTIECVGVDDYFGFSLDGRDGRCLLEDYTVTHNTETVKDLGKALAIAVYVFNCSEQMDYKSIGNIFKGLAQSGTWGCFDEFNRISVEVLSVVATQVKSIQDALRARKKRFIFQGEEIGLVRTVGEFITMNPGYAGRTELPENIKALFRPCSMVVPNLELICEIMLMAEGFIEASSLARKFNTLYKLNRELLSKQDHYDWGLRAIKSVLVVAGSLKRSDPNVPEEHVLMRALRDFNLPKIVTDDLQVFHGLIGDLFPKVEVPRKRNERLEEEIRKATVENGLQAEDIFVLKVVQLEELMAVRHCVFIIGNSGTGKSQIWKMLSKTYVNMGRKCTTSDLNPKAVSTDDLFGCINPSTREWKDGLFSYIMREMASAPGTDPKWMILDGDIDPNWIESLNTVMDDNKMLTLASNERIPLKNHMRLVFEIGNLKYATPATVSRAGILYLNTTDLGWNPYVQSWLEKREDAAERSNLSVLFDRYVNPCLEACRSGRFKMANVEEFSMVVALCNILEGLLTPVNTPKGCDKEWFELYFVFAAVWAFGGCVFQDQMADYRNEFSKWWNSEFKVVKFPPSGTVFDYFIDTETKRFLPWTDRVPVYEYDPEMPLQAVLVHTQETTRVRYFLDLLADNGKPVLLIGNAGCGKTVLMQDKLNSYGEDRLIVNVPFNFYTTAWSLQAVLEKPLEKKAGRNYGPPGNKKIIYFLDDLNMPEVDKYGTASPHTLLRQFLDYRHWYDRAKLTLKEIHNCQYVACMNPTAGSFTIDPRLQRHFACFSVNFPGVESLQSIYLQILNGHLKSFPPSMQKLSERIVTAALLLHKKVSTTFLPTAIKFHYVFNLRDLSNIFQGILFSTKEKVKDAIELVRLFIHETSRTYGDKMIDETDRQSLVKLQEEIMKKNFEDMDQASLKAEPNIFAHFAGGMGEPKYGQVKEWAQLRKLLDEAQMQYEEVNAAMNLVLFEDAMSHICRINRILESPRGNALLVGVGGSGKQSLSRLAAFISQMEVFQITLRKGYSINDLKTDLASLYIKTGQKKMQIMFLLTDSQIADEKFLVLINDLLASGNIPGLFPDDEVESIINSMRGEAKAQGLVDTREVCWEIFIRFVRRNLKVVLCFSPVGNTLRSRCRKFPAIVNCTMIDWFQEWPEEALTSVANRFISTFDLVPEPLKVPVTKFMSFAHMGVNAVSRKYLLNEKRYNYTTPKSFLALIALYKEMLEKKALELTKSMDRLENGLTKLQATAGQVDDLKAKLATQEVELKSKNEEANRLIERVAIDTEKVNKEKAIAAEEEKKVDAITKEVNEKKMACEKDLSAAEPALAAASNALNTLNKANLTELKSFGSPSEEVKNVAAACMVLLSPPGKIAKDRSWKASKNMMAKVDAFLESLINFNKEAIDQSNLDALQPYLQDPNFNEEFMRSKSIAAASLCAWAVNIVKYYHVYCDVEPKRKALEAANAELQTSQARLRDIQAKIGELDRNLADLRAKFEKATADKLRCEEEAKSTQETIVLANRLVNGLASEKVRWSEAVGKFKEQEKTLAGDVLISAAFVSYVGCFSKRYREELLNDNWLRYLRDENNAFRVPLSDGVDPLSILTNSAEIAKWNNEGLPTDRVSLENATMVTSCKRWPLIIDPQLQGVTWIKNREGAGLKVVRLGARGYLDSIEKAVSSGDAVLIEDIAESIDPVLNPLLGRETIKKGRYIKMGDKEVEYDARFKLILQTRLANPHYPPEIQAQTTLINFTVTIAGLEDQLLADVVNIERPDLEKTKADLTKQQNEFKIKLTELEDALLSRLSAAQGNFLGDTALVENLEITKSTATDIEQKVEEAKRTEKKINETRELYRPVAARSSLLYFLLNDLWQIHPMYQYSLNAYKVVFKNAINRADASEDIKERVLLLIDSITYMVFVYTTRGLFERDKLIFTAQMTFQILIAQGDIEYAELDFLLRAPRAMGVNSTLEWLSTPSWGMIKALSNLEIFRTLASDIEGSSKQWKKYCENECPENEKLPQEWKNKTPLQKMCILRCLRPDRMTYAVRNFVGMKMGQRFIEAARVPLAKSFEESAPATPVFFILSPGVDPVKDVEALGRQLGVSEDNGNFHNVSLGQGQEVIAEQKLDIAYKNGGWVMLENIHLVAKWLPTLEKKLEALSLGAHPDFRVFLSAEPAGDPAYHIIPISILQASIKITNEPPTGMQANIHRALDNFSQETLERCSKDAEFKAILFALCYFHAVVLERRKFGTQGWNKPYPFSTGDLMISVDVLFNYLETFAKVPWTDLRYIFGEIMYGGHISDDWDRRLCSAYLDVYLREEMLDGNFELAPGFGSPPTSDYKEYHRYIDDNLPPESPYLYGLHPNAEIGVLTKMADKLFKTILEMQPRDTAGGTASSKEEKVKAMLDEIMEKLPDSFNVAELIARVEERTPYISVAIQECDRMSMLTTEIRRSLKELELGLKGDLTISEHMELLMNSLYLNEVPARWEKLAYPSLQPLGAWYGDLLLRIKELEAWVAEFNLPSVVWLPGLFNPQSFLTAIMQTTARKNEWPLDRMVLTVDVTKKAKEEFTGAPREGAYIHGLFMEGARWDTGTGMIQESLLKELTPAMPVIYIKAIPVDKKETKGVYECPVYRTRQRGPTFVWTFNLKTKERPQKWILAGVCLLCSAE